MSVRAKSKRRTTKTTRIRFRPEDTPDAVHGRLSEDVHISGYTSNRACDALSWLFRQDRWKRVSPGYEDIDTFLATVDASEFKYTREQRQTLVQQLAAIQAGQRATARLLGVSESTVRNDKGAQSCAPSSAEITGGAQQSTKYLEFTAQNNALPKPYYSEAGLTIYHGDARKLVPLLEPGLIVTDPPYNVDYHYNEHDDAMESGDYQALLGAVLRLPFVVIHYPEALFPLAATVKSAPDKVVAWIYHANTPRQWRAVAWFGLTPDLSKATQPYRNPDDKRIRALMAQGREARLYDWWPHEQVKNVSDEKTGHPCQIPTELMERILKVTLYDGPVIDPFMGSGTTLVAARGLGRRAVGIESSEEYCEIAALRLRQPSQLRHEFAR